MYSRLLFATNLSEASDLALDCVAGWKGTGLSKVTVAHVHAIHLIGSTSHDVARESPAPVLVAPEEQRDANLRVHL